MNEIRLYGPFKQFLPMSGLPLHGALNDSRLSVLKHYGVVTERGIVKETGNYTGLSEKYSNAKKMLLQDKDLIALPAFVDCHTHICWAGTRAHDYAMRVAGKSYLEIGRAGGGIMDTVKATREASQDELFEKILQRVNRHLQRGIATIEIKSGYGLTAEDELKMLRAIKTANEHTPADLIPTFLGAHIKPTDFKGDSGHYLDMLVDEVVPEIQKENLAKRADIFVEEGAFETEQAAKYAQTLQHHGFDITMHVDQFSPGGSQTAIEYGCVSADHLEFCDQESIKAFEYAETTAVALPGASLGLGMQFAPCRKLLDHNACLAIATDWNPGSAPMGDLITQASVLGAKQKLSIAETLAAVTFRAAYALRLNTGTIEEGKKAKIVVYKTEDYRNIFYQQGQLSPVFTIIGEECTSHV